MDKITNESFNINKGVLINVRDIPYTLVNYKVNSESWMVVWNIIRRSEPTLITFSPG